MPSSLFKPFYVFSKDLGDGVHKLSTDVLKVIFTNSVPNLTNDFVRGDIGGSLASANGYPSTGLAVEVSSFNQVDGLATLQIVDETFTPSGGSVGPFRYIVLYNETSATDALIGYWDYGQSITVGDSEPFTLDFDGTNGVITINVK